MGMQTAQAFILALMTLVIVGVLSVIIFDALGKTDNLDTSFTRTEELCLATENCINTTGYELDGSKEVGFKSATITTVTNTTSGSLIAAPNYTLSSGGLVTNTTPTEWNAVTFNYTYVTKGDGGQIIQNGSAGLVSFFSNATTWLTLLSVVIIILIIASVIAIVSRFTGGRAMLK